MGSYFMYEQSIDVELRIDLLNFDLNATLDTLLDEINESISSIDFVLNKYSWDGKKAYEPRSHQEIINDARSHKAYLLIFKRKLERKLKE